MTSKAKKGVKKSSGAKTDAGSIPAALTPSEVRMVVLEALSDEGRIREMPTLHSNFDHLDRKIDFNDVLHGLSREWLSCKPDKFNADEWQWKYQIATQDLEERAFTIVVALDAKHKRVTIVTRWPND
jgi:hypothetical protein